MKINKANLALAIGIILLALAMGNSALAWEGTYSLSTGISTTTVDGTVIVPPTADPSPGVYDSPQTVTLFAGGSTSIRYTNDGNPPTCSAGTVYSGAISVDFPQVISAISCYQNNHSYSSSVAVFGYVIEPVVVVTPTPTPTPTPVSGGGGGGSVSAAKTGDINLDNKIDEYDFGMMMFQWGETGSGLSADLNKDGVVDEYDFAILMLHWGE